MSETNAGSTISMLLRCLPLKAGDFDPPQLSMPPDVDVAWHEALLCTEDYWRLCERVVGTGAFVEHCTRSAIDGEAEKGLRMNAMAQK